VCGVLKRSVNPILELRVEMIEGNTASFNDERVAKIVSEFNPDLILHVLTIHVLKEAKELLASMTERQRAVPILVAIEDATPADIFGLLRAGAADFLVAPPKPSNMLPRIRRWLGLGEPAHARSFRRELGLAQLIGESPAFMEELRKIPAVATCDAGVLLLGETGTGKEGFARAIHSLSPRASWQFVPVDCGAIPVDLVENELFGHERGAYTGASRSQFGVIHQADGGTLFLDEIGCLPILAQVKLLRFLEEKEYRPLGSSKTSAANVRVIAAANNSLEEDVKAGGFRQDLYYRLNIVPFTLPPLRKRRDDIPLLARHFLSRYGTSYNKVISDLLPDALHKLVAYDWPGNVRELEHTIERAVVYSDQEFIRGKDIVLPASEIPACEQSFQQAKTEMVAKFEKRYIEELLLAYDGNISKSARAAQKNRRAFWQLIRKHRIDVRSFRPEVRHPDG
jgi:DNA-binding NtrC family response regulator